MPIPNSIVGLSVDPIEHRVDARWTMAHAAALDEDDPSYFDTTAPGGIVAHPLFTVCPEWPAIVASRVESEQLGISRAEIMTGVHATHDVAIHRLIRPGDVLTTSLQITGLVGISPGAKATTRLHTVDSGGQLVATTTQDGIYLGVPVDGTDVPDPDPPPKLAGVERVGDPIEVAVPVAAGAAHTYTECARIWNPIHTDRQVALAAGLPDIILHGTANLAHGVSVVVARRGNSRPELVRRIIGRFAAMVRMPSTLTVRVWPANHPGDGRAVVPFDVLNGEGAPAVKDGVVVLGEPGPRQAK